MPARQPLRNGPIRARTPRAKRFAGMIGAVVLLAAACGGDDAATADGTGQGAPDGDAATEAWCSSMVERKTALRVEYGEVFTTAPDGDDTPSSALLSLDGSADAAESLRSYVLTLAENEPAEIAGASVTVAEELDELIEELEATPGQPGNAFIGGLGAVGAFATLDGFALEHCGETL